MTLTAPVAPVRTPVTDTELVRADQVTTADRVGRFGDRVTKVIISGEATTICLDTPHGPSISEDRSDRRILIARRQKA